MKISRVVCLLFALVCAIPAFAQSSSKVEVDYNNPKKYIVGGVDVEGNEHFAPSQILQITGCQFIESAKGGYSIRLDDAPWEKITIKDNKFVNSGKIRANRNF